MLVRLDLIETGTRLRGVTVEQVMALAESMKEVGLLCPITLYEREVIRAGIAVQGYGLIAGLHRMEAARGLGWDEIEAQVVTLPELNRQLAECDENLCGTKLTQAERALFTRRRKDIYEAIHPETRHGAVGRGGKSDPNIGSFVDDTAGKTGRSRSSIAADAARGERVDEDVLADIIGTDLDRGVVLDEIAATPREQQAAKVADLRAAKAARLLAEEEAKESRKAAAVTDAAIRATDAQEFAAWIERHCAVSEINQIITWLQGTKAKDVIAALRRVAA